MRFLRRDRRAGGYTKQRAAALAVVVGCVSALAGCGTPAPADFGSRYRAASADFDAKSGAIQRKASAVVGGKSVEQKLSVYADILDATKEAHKGYSQLQAPNEVKPAFTRMLEAMQQQIDVLEQIQGAAKANQGSRLVELLQELGTLTNEYMEARSEMDRLLEQVKV